MVISIIYGGTIFTPLCHKVVLVFVNSNGKVCIQGEYTRSFNEVNWSERIIAPSKHCVMRTNFYNEIIFAHVLYISNRNVINNFISVWTFRSEQIQQLLRPDQYIS